jgi:serine/threonine-protein kinase RsbW
MPTVEVQFSALPAHVRTARLVATAVARRAGVADELLDEVRLAVGEACSRAVDLHARHSPDRPIQVTLTDEQDRFIVTVVDEGPAGEAVGTMLEALDTDALAEPTTVAGSGSPEPLGDLLPPGFGLAVISGLVDDVDVESGPAGTRVRMSWPAHDVMAPDPHPGG